MLRASSEPRSDNTPKTSSSIAGLNSCSVVQRQHRQIDAFGYRTLHGMRHDLVRVTKRQALLDQIVGQVGGCPRSP